MDFIIRGDDYMGKVVILGGNARSGKTTLALKLVKHGFSRISLDNIQTYLEDGLGLDFDSLGKIKQNKFFETIVMNAIEESKNEDANIVIDMYDYLPEDLINIKGIEDVLVYFLAYPNCSIDEIKYNVVHYAKESDWISKVNEEYLLECSKRFFERNAILVEECEKYGFMLVDTKSGEDRNIVLNNLLNEIISLKNK